MNGLDDQGHFDGIPILGHVRSARNERLSGITLTETPETTIRQTSLSSAEGVTWPSTDGSKLSPSKLDSNNQKPLLPAGLKPYYEHNGIAIILGDCRDVLPTLVTGSVDLVLTDIPYNASQDSNGLRRLDYGDWDKGFNYYPYFQSLLLMQPKSIYVWCGDTQFSPILVDLRAAGYLDRPMVWAKRNPTVINGQHLWLPGTELCVFGKRPGAPFFAHCQTNVFDDSPDIDRLHPSQKPLEIIKRQVLASSSKDDLILDPFMGSGTTLVAAQSLGRKAIGIEIEEKYCAIAVKRLRQMPLALEYTKSHDIIRPMQGGLLDGSFTDRGNET